MSTSVSWPVIGGTSYSVPAASEVNWPALSNYLIALAGAQGTTSQLTAIRQATTTPVTVVSASDCVIVCKLAAPGAVAVNLPAGVNGQYYVICDGTGDAATNNITITPNGAETINGAATYVIKENRGAVVLFYQTTQKWSVVAEFMAATNQGSTGTGLIVRQTSPTFVGTVTVPILIGTDTTDSSSSTTGAFKTAGGLGVAKNLFVGGTAGVSVEGSGSFTGGKVVEGGQASIYGDANSSYFSHNVYYAAGWKSSSNANHNQILFDSSGNTNFNYAATSIAGSAITWTTNGSISSAGLWTIGVSGSTQNHIINGTFSASKSNSSGGADWSFKNTGASPSGVTLTLGANRTSSGAVSQLILENTVENTNVQLYSYRSGSTALDMYFRTYNAGTVEAGNISAAGAWTLGPSGTSLTTGHTIQSAHSTNTPTLTVQCTKATSARVMLNLSPATGTDGSDIKWSGTGGLYFKNTSNTEVAQISNTGSISVYGQDVTETVLAINTTAAASSTKRVFDAQYTVDTDCTGGYFYTCLNSSGTVIGRIEAASNTTTSFTGSSDQRLKQNPTDFDGLALVAQMIPREYEWMSNPGKRQKGFFAQELYQVLPDAVSVGSDELTEDGNLQNPWGIDYSRLTPVLAKAIQELKAENDALKARLDALEAK